MTGTPIVGGIIQVKANGQIYSAKGDFTWNPGIAKNEAVIGSDGVHGWKTTPQVPFIEGEFTDRGDVDMVALRKLKGATVYLDLANGRAFVLRDACFASDGTGHTDEGNMDVRFEGLSGEVV
jgi:hypothetical protein